jgi:CheY-like chemotaxis protein
VKRAGGLQAIEIGRREKLDLVFLDLGPSLTIDGLEVLERILATRACPWWCLQRPPFTP